MRPGLITAESREDSVFHEAPRGIFVALHGDFVRHPWQDADDDLSTTLELWSVPTVEK